MKRVFNKSIFSFVPNFPWKNAKGFSLIGVLVAAAIGLIVVGGIVQLFVNMTAQIKQVENRAGLRTFKTLMERSLQDTTGCANTLGGLKGELWDNASGTGAFDFDEIKNANGDTVIDVYPLTSSLEAEYGLTGSVIFRASCLTSPCDCSNFSNWAGTPISCDNTWSISLVSQSAVQDSTVYNKPQLLADVNISFTDSRPTPFTPDLNLSTFTCNGISIGALLPPAIGCLTLEVGGDERSLVGCGTTQDATKSGVTSFGFNSGSIDAGRHNTFLGHSTGPSTTSEKNTFAGNEAGFANTTGSANNFFGYRAGSTNTKGAQNNFFGNEAGYSSTKGTQNSFFGTETGYSNTEGNQNSFFGNEAGRGNITGDQNSFFGFEAGGRNITGSGNIYIGYNAANKSGYTTASNRFVVGNDLDETWIVGEIGSNTLTVNSNQVCLSSDVNCDFTNWVSPTTATPPNVRICLSDGTNCDYTNWGAGTTRICLQDGTNCPATTGSGGTPSHTHPFPSSRAVKKKIKPFEKYQKALADILKTPLFTYQYKKDPLKKDRMGVISEELPDHLQIKEKGQHSRPDWPSIYGTLWAGIKALHKIQGEFKQELVSQMAKIEKTFLEDLKQFKQKVFSKFQVLGETLNTLQSRVEELFKQFAQFQTKFSSRLDQAEGKWDLTEKNLSEVQKGLKQSHNNLSEIKKELAETKQKLMNTQNNLTQKHRDWDANHRLLLKENQELRRELSSLKEQIKNIQKESGNKPKE